MDKDFFIKVVDDEGQDTLLKFSLVDCIKCLNYKNILHYDSNGNSYCDKIKYELMFTCIGIDRVFFKECSSQIEMQMIFAKFQKMLGNEELNEIL